jgi:hypothetical protein
MRNLNDDWDFFIAFVVSLDNVFGATDRIWHGMDEKVNGPTCIYLIIGSTAQKI